MKKYITFTVSIEKEVTKNDRNGERITKDMSSRLQFIDNTKSQILSIIFLKEFIKLNVNSDMVIKNVKLGELDINIVTIFFFETKILKLINRIQVIILWQKLSKKVWWKVKGTIF